LKPREPALDQATELPFTSVIVTTVLLKVDWIWAIPVAMFFLTFFFCGFPFGVAAPGATLVVLPALDIVISYRLEG
jgi:hypothetical protein